MAAIKFIKRTVALDGSNITEQLPASFFTGEYSAHTFIIAAIRENEALMLSGTITANFVNANDEMVPITACSIVDGTAVVTLSDGCYHVNGRFTLTIYVNGAAVYDCASRIQRRSTNSAYDPSHVIPNLAEIQAEVAAMRAATASATAAAAAADNVDIDLTTGTDEATITITRSNGTTKSQTIRAVVGDDYNALKSSFNANAFTSNTFIVPSNTTHQATADQIPVSIKTGESFMVGWINGSAKVFYEDNTDEAIVAANYLYYGVASKNIKAFGVYLYNNTGTSKTVTLCVAKSPVGDYIVKKINDYETSIDEIEDSIDDLNMIVVKTEMPVSSDYSGILEKYAGYIASSNYAPVSNGGYDTYSFKIEKECNVYFDGLHGASYISIIGYDSTTFNQWHDVTSFLRYKENEEDTLPYSGNKMNIPANTYIAVTVNKDADFYLYGTELIFSKSINPDISIPSQSTINKIRVIKKGETIKVYQKSNVASNRYTRYTFKRATIPARAYDSWKLWSIDIVDSSENIQYSLENGGETECEGAIYETGKSDYIGGYHGDEYYTDINCIIDGKIYDLSSDFSVDCMELTITVVSYLNHCDTQTKVFDRVKTLTWTFEKISIMNYYKAVDSINVGVAAIGILSAHKKNDDVTKINKMKCNWKGSIENIPTNNVAPYGTMIDENVAFTKGELMGSNVYISAQIKNFEKTAHNSFGRFTDFVERMKIYLYPISDYEMQSGDYFVCTADYVVVAVE